MNGGQSGNQEQTVRQTAFESERKSFEVLHKRNARGEFVKIVERRKGGDRPSTVILPVSGVETLVKAFRGMGLVN